MDFNILINLIIIINIVLSLSANIPIAGESFKKKLQPVLTKNKTYLQSFPKYISSLIFLLIIAGLFGLGKMEIQSLTLNIIRVISALMYVLFSWLQIYAIKQLKESYSADLVIYKNHQLIDKGLFRIVRHPIYLSQLFQDFFAGIALINLPIILLTIFVETPLYLARANREEELLERNLSGYSDYKKRTSKWLPKIF